MSPLDVMAWGMAVMFIILCACFSALAVKTLIKQWRNK